MTNKLHYCIIDNVKDRLLKTYPRYQNLKESQDMTYKFEYKNAELFASKMSTYGYRLFIMIDHENGTYFYGQSHNTVVSLHKAEYIHSMNMLQRDIRKMKDQMEARGYHKMTDEEWYKQIG